MGDCTSKPSVFKRATAALVSLALVSGCSFGANTSVALADKVENPGISTQDAVSTYPADKSPSTGQALAGISGSYDRAAAAALLSFINEIRAEAKTEGIIAIKYNNDAYYNESIVANGSALGWNNEVENYAMIRAAEHGTIPDIAHTRPDGTASKDSIPKASVGLENLAWHPSAASGLQAWYQEKDAYVQHLDYLKYKGTASESAHPDTTKVWGHYSTLIANEWHSVGLGWFVPDGAQYGNGGLAGEFSDKPADSTTVVTRDSGDCIQNAVFKADNLSGSIAGPTTVAKDGTADYTATVKLSDAAKGTYGISSALTVPSGAGSWSSSDTAKATVDSSGKVSGIAAGNTNIAYSVNGTQLATKAITVEVLTIASVTAPDDVPTAAGTAPTLPSAVHVKYTNNTEADVPVTWDSVPASDYHGGPSATSFNVQGTVAGWTPKVSVKVNVAAATKVSAVDPAGVTTAAGIAPTLPAKATITWSNSDTTQENVTWDSIAPAQYHGPDAASFNAAGKVAGFDVTCAVSVTAATSVSVANPAGVSTAAGTAPVLPTQAQVTLSNGDKVMKNVSWDSIPASKYHGPAATSFNAAGTVDGLSVTCPVTVTAATATSVSNPSGVTTAAGTAPTLPTTAAVTWSNGDTANETISWDSIDTSKYHGPAAGSFNATGKVAGLDVTCAVSVTAATVTSVVAPAAVTAVVDVAPVLPEKLTVTWSNGDTTQESVMWDSIPSTDYDHVGSFTVNGICSGQAVTCTVNVVAAVIDGVTNPADVSTAAGTAPVLPSTVSAHFSNDVTGSVAVTWDPVVADKYHGGPQATSFNVEGTVSGWANKVSVKVNVAAATPVTAVTPVAVTTPAGTAPALPATAEVMLSNGDRVQELVVWSTVDPSSYHNGGSFTVPGIVEGLAISCTVAVANAYVIDPVGSASTPAGVEITIPGTIPVTWSNGDVTNESVAWPPVNDSQFATPGSFSIPGTFIKGSPAETFNVSYEVTVTDAVAIKANSTDPIKVETAASTAPVLPETILCEMSDGTVKEVPVTWEAIDPQRYAEGGTFRVVGEVQGVNGPIAVTAEVNVHPAKNGDVITRSASEKSVSFAATTVKTGDSVDAALLLVGLGSIALLLAGLASRMRRSMQ